MRRKGPVPLYELAEELKVDPKVIIQILRENGYKHVRSKTHNLNRDMEMLRLRKRTTGGGTRSSPARRRS